jgi:Zn-dependent peptidase ImmA (M78 family)
MKLAKNLIKKYNTNNPFEICDYLNYIVIQTPLTGVRGFYQFFEKNNIIYVDKDLDCHIKNFVCAHELGHSIMHKGTNEIFMDTRTFLKTSIYERQADKFAVNFLYPDDSLFIDLKDYTVGQISRYLYLDENVVMYRISEIKK